MPCWRNERRIGGRKAPALRLPWDGWLTGLFAESFQLVGITTEVNLNRPGSWTEARLLGLKPDFNQISSMGMGQYL